jgi:haloacetate dehalogenase
MFDGFVRKQIETRETTINLVQGGHGDPILLLHVCWHQVAPTLAERFKIVCPELRGLGDSAKPLSDPEYLAYSKRVMAQHQVDVMQSLGFNKFAFVGHDRGARGAHRTTLDHSQKITKLALLDIIPTSTVFANADKDIATGAFNWFFLIQPDELPERLIGAEPAFSLQWILDHWESHKGALAPEAVAAYQRCFAVETIRATNEEFRAAATIDLIHDQADQQRKISCPTLVLWSKDSWSKFDVLEGWKSYAEDVHGVAFACGHFLPEEDPEWTAAELGSYGIRLVVIGSAESPDTPEVQATLKLHARATGRTFEEVLADSGRETLLGRLPSVTEVANVATLMASDYASAMTGVIANVTCGYIVD